LATSRGLTCAVKDVFDAAIAASACGGVVVVDESSDFAAADGFADLTEHGQEARLQVGVARSD
jgi:hypothetical protein